MGYRQRTTPLDRSRLCPCVGVRPRTVDGEAVVDWHADPDCDECRGSGLRPPEPLSDEARAIGAEPIPPGFEFDRDGSHISGSRGR